MPNRTKTIPLANPEESQSRMSVGQHLDELRKRVMRALFGSIFAIVACMYYANDIVEFLLRPYRLAMRAHHDPQAFLYNKPPEIIMNYLMVGLQAGLIISSPWIIYQLWQFVASGLFPRERKIVYKYIGPSALLFLIGVAFFYFIVLPLTLGFFLSFTDNTATAMPQPNAFETALGLGDKGQSLPEKMKTWVESLFGNPPPPATSPATASAPATQMPLFPIPELSADPPAPPPGAVLLYFNTTENALKFRTPEGISTLLVIHGGSLFINQPRFDDYLDFVLFMALLFGLAFEMPMVIVVLAQVGIVAPATLRRVRKYAYFILAGIAAVAAPSGDIGSLIALTLPLIALYEVGIVAAAFVTRHKVDPPESQ